MIPRGFWDAFPISYDITQSYSAQRGLGRGRDEVVDGIKKEYSEECLDSDDECAVQLGISLALCKKHELTEEAKIAGQTALRLLRDTWSNETNIIAMLDKIQVLLEYPLNMGEEAHYPRRKIYIPDWQIGDVFIHPLTNTLARYVGLEGQNVVFIKVGEYISQDAQHHQLVFVSFCRGIPKSVADLPGYLRLMPCGSREKRTWEYLGQIHFKNRKDEARWELTKVASFSQIPEPKDWKENPSAPGAFPIFGYMDGYLWYRDELCRRYRDFGVG